MQVEFTTDKNGATSTIVSGATTQVATGTGVRICFGDRVWNGGLVDGENEYRAIIDLPEDSAGTVEVRSTTDELLDSLRLGEEEQPRRKKAK